MTYDWNKKLKANLAKYEADRSVENAIYLLENANITETECTYQEVAASEGRLKMLRAMISRYLVHRFRTMSINSNLQLQISNLGTGIVD